MKIKNVKLQQSMMYAFCVSGTNLNWLYEIFARDAGRTLDGYTSGIQMSAYSMGFALRWGLGRPISFAHMPDVVEKLSDIIELYSLSSVEKIPCILALGWSCDQRYGDNPLSWELLARAREALKNCLHRSEQFARSCNVALKLLEGAVLNADDEQYLLQMVKKFES